MKNIDKKIERIEQGDAWKESDTVVELKVKRPLDKVIPIRIQEEHWQMLRYEARGLGVGPTTLARMWILERLRSKNTVYQDIIQNITDKIWQENRTQDLTEREFEILKLIEQGYLNQQITKELSINKETLQRHISEILRKLHEKPGIWNTNASKKEASIDR